MHAAGHRLFILGCFVLAGCKLTTTLPMHDPIYPASGNTVTYTLDAGTNAGIDRIRLFETISTVDAAGTVVAGAETLLQEWTPAGSPTSTNVTFTKTGGYSSNRLVSYRFEVTDGDGSSRSHDVTYAIRPYPVANQPAPVYAQGDINRSMDVIFIPDSDVTNMTTWRDHCRRMITEAMWNDSTVRFWTRQFNYYINPLTGTATDYDRIAIDGLHQLPTNAANLTFAEARVLMHQNNLRDYASGGLFSTEMQNRGTMLHEGGHALFGGADEYANGVHSQATELPNNWTTLAGAQADAPSRHKTTADAVQMGTSGWYKICLDTCQLKITGLVAGVYDDPCRDRVTFTVLDNALHP